MPNIVTMNKKTSPTKDKTQNSTHKHHMSSFLDKKKLRWQETLQADINREVSRRNVCNEASLLRHMMKTQTNRSVTDLQESEEIFRRVTDDVRTDARVPSQGDHLTPAQNINWWIVNIVTHCKNAVEVKTDTWQDGQMKDPMKRKGFEACGLCLLECWNKNNNRLYVTLLLWKTKGDILRNVCLVV